ncbi:MarR family transcriptional regulator [Enterococcus faecalis]|uniref:MarR family transcriptional regulator n=1 Tax=Enterococcus faecalis TaxID=1351 RepID=UPI00404296A1
MSALEEFMTSFDKLLDEKLDEKLDKRMEIIEESHFAQSQQTLFTKAELSAKWRCSKGHVDRILKKYGIEPVGKSGKENLYSISESQEAKNMHDNKMIQKEKLNWKIRAMQPIQTK